MAYPAAPTITSADWSAEIQSQTSTITAQVARFRMANDPYANVLGSGVFPAGSGETLNTQVPTQFVSGYSLTAPAFSAKKGSCAITPAVGKHGFTNYTTSIKRATGRLPTICLNDQFYAVDNSLKNAIGTAEDMISKLLSAHTRAELLAMSGTKIKLKSDTLLGNMTGGTTSSVAVNWSSSVPTYGISHQFLVYLSNYVRENLFPDLFGAGSGAALRGVFSSEVVEAMRNQDSVKLDLRSFAQGSYADGKKALTEYTWAEMPYRGLQLGVDTQPLRYNVVDGSGNPVFIEPLIEVVADSGSSMEINPDWIDAKYEVGFLFGNNAVNRLVPESYTGEAGARFSQKDYAGKLAWHNQIDNENNLWGDLGFFKYNIEDAFQPVKPHTIIPITYKRMKANLGLVTGDGYDGNESL